MATLDPKLRLSDKSSPKYSVNLNVVLSGSKKMSEDELHDAVKDEPDFVSVSITDPENGKVLVSGLVWMKLFATGSVGYSLQQTNVWFKEQE